MIPDDIDDDDNDDKNSKWPKLGQFWSYNLKILHGARSKWYLQDDDVDDNGDDDDDKDDENPKWP